MAILLSVIGLGLLILGGEVLVRNAAGLALKAGMSPLFVGLTVVAMGTSSPELAASLGAAFNGLGGLALGNVVGSNIANIGLVLGLAALARPLDVKPRLVRWDLPLMIVALIALFLMLSDRFLGRLEGSFLAAGLVAYVVISATLSRKPRDKGPGDWKKREPRPAGHLWAPLLGVGLGLLLLVYGGRILVQGAASVAAEFGVTDAMIGLTVVAVGTSLPELVTSLIAVAKGHHDIALGNVVGSNLFNTLFVLGVTGSVTPVGSSSVRFGDLVVMMGMSVLLLPFLWTRSRLGRWEGGLLFVAYIAYTAWVVAR
ncbi:MAG: calcium/sodium antiporter [Gemmatimonadota bacterium]|jgi:cation:H+ antiporter